MTTLYNRATPRQAVVLRMIEGAVRNAAHAHPNQPLDDRMARSIAKRAAGTLTAQWAAVLAAPRARSEGESENGKNRTAAGAIQLRNRSGRVGPTSGGSGPRDASELQWRVPLHLLHKSIASQCGAAKHAGNVERLVALVDVLRLIGRVVEMPEPPRGRIRFGGGPAGREAMVDGAEVSN
jgi:hypothetical protein